MDFLEINYQAAITTPVASVSSAFHATSTIVPLSSAAYFTVTHAAEDADIVATVRITLLFVAPGAIAVTA